MISILQMYLQAEQIDSADMELEVVETAEQEVGGTGEEIVEGMDETCESLELQQISGDQPV